LSYPPSVAQNDTDVNTGKVKIKDPVMILVKGGSFTIGCTGSAENTTTHTPIETLQPCRGDIKQPCPQGQGTSPKHIPKKKHIPPQNKSNKNPNKSK
jgi:hypothetical protein